MFLIEGTGQQSWYYNIIVCVIIVRSFNTISFRLYKKNAAHNLFENGPAVLSD